MTSSALDEPKGFINFLNDKPLYHPYGWELDGNERVSQWKEIDNGT
jgi:hypothetical protein